MEVFFNELSVRPASSDTEARQWLETLADVGKLLQETVKSLSENQFTFRRSEDFGQLPLTATQTLLEFLLDQYDFGDAVYVFLLGVFDSPYITENDPKHEEYGDIWLTFDGKGHSVTGLAAAYLKNALAVSFDNNIVWDTCQFEAQINRLDAGGTEQSSIETIDHASRRQHIIDCHLTRLANLFDWNKYRPKFDYDNRKQTILSLITLYTIHVQSWRSFYFEISQLNERERVAKINVMAERIAIMQRWHPATGSLKTRNSERTIYTIPNSDLIVSVDTEQGEFEVHVNKKGNNHLGAISFDGKRFKDAVKNRKLNL